MIATSDGAEARQAGAQDQVARVLVVVVVVDGHADVVEHARGPQQLALARVARVQPERRELVEHRERESRDVARVRDVHAVARGEVEHARAPDVIDQRRVRRREVALEEDALAQPGLRHFHAVEAPRRP